MDTCSPFANENFIDVGSSFKNHSHLPVMCTDAPLFANQLSIVATIVFAAKIIALFSVKYCFKSLFFLGLEQIAAI